MKLFALKAALALAGIWLVVAGIVWLARGAQPTPESIRKYIAAHPLDAQAAEMRADTVADVANRLNQLEREPREELRKSGEIEQFFKTLTPEEQVKFLDLTLPAGFQQLMEAFNEMPREKRQRLVENALKRMRESGTEPPGDMDGEQAAKVIDHGLRAYYSAASAETKLDLAPLIEQMQRNLQHQ